MKTLSLVVKITTMCLILGLLFWGLTGCKSQKNPEKAGNTAVEEHDHDSHAGHDHGEALDEDIHDEHEGHMEHDEDRDEIEHEGHDHLEGGIENDEDDHGAEIDAEHSEHEGHAHELEIVTLSNEALELAGIKTEVVKLGKISKVIELPGEVGLNEDRVVHITPRFGGVANKVFKNQGDYVRQGDQLAEIESNESMSSYFLRAPISGRIIEKHISNGEHVNEETSVFIIADLSQVWINLAVYPKDAQHVRKGQQVMLECVGNEQCTVGEISYVSDVYSAETRRLTARMVLPNPDGKWKPGMFIRAKILVESQEYKKVVTKDAIQITNQKPTVFVVKDKTEFALVNVELGEYGEELVEIIGGDLELGDEYVSNGAFDIKAHLVTSSLDAHAGHGH